MSLARAGDDPADPGVVPLLLQWGIAAYEGRELEVLLSKPIQFSQLGLTFDAPPAVLDTPDLADIQEAP